MDTVSRRNFLGATAGTVGIATAGGTITMAQAAAQESAAAGAANVPAKKTGMRVGMLTAPFNGEPLENVIEFASKSGIAALEVWSEPGGSQIDLATFDAARAEAIKKLLDQRGVEISALANYANMTEEGRTEELQAMAKKLIDAAVLLGVSVVCMQTGMPVGDRSRVFMIKKVVPQVYAPIIAYAKEKGIKIALENWFETCLLGIDTFECLFETITDDNFGLNYDPSHLVHQQCNHMLPLSMFPKRIFHTHAKDTRVDVEKRAKVGVYGDGWWRYVIPGFGNINWGEYIGYLRSVGYKGVLSIEHEDSSFDREEGFAMGARHLNQFC